MRFLGISGLALVAMACSGDPSSVVPIVPQIVAVQGALDGVTELKVYAFDSAAVTCDPKRAGYTVGALDSKALDAKGPIATKVLSNVNCAGGAKYCGDLQIDKGKTKNATFVIAGSSAQKQLATACNSPVALDKDTQQLSMKVYRFFPIPMCGGKPSAFFATQCTMPGNDMDPVCDQDCLSKEEYLSTGSGGAGETSDGKAKTRPSFAWVSSGDPEAGRFFAFFGDSSQPARNQVSMRVLAPDMTPCSGANCNPDRGPYVQKNSFFIPDNSGMLPTAGDMNSQTNPSAVAAASKYFVAFEDGTPPKISLKSVNANLGSDQAANAAIAVSTGGSGLARPSIASNGSKVLVVWQAADGVHGRIADTANPSMLGAEQTYGPGIKPTVAGTSSGFVVAWQSGADVKIRATDASGVATGAEIKVNDATHMGSQESPAVGSLPDGSVAVVWADTGAPGIFVQRYAPGLMPIMGDQAKRINDITAGQPCNSPAIGAGSGADAFFAVAWVNGTDNHVYARFLDGKGGFLFNPVDGQASEFKASRLDGTPRANPTVAVGGGGPYVAIGWEAADGGPSPLGAPANGATGIWGRRFPLPAK